ncbi:MAG: type II CRISPR RNA-guided endonuclease Cas9 [Roseburia sp.]
MMMKNYGEKYYLGLDLGTSSVGWAVTDENYKLRRAKGKDLWGSRLFDEANSCAERRSHRTSRRRTDRERARIAMLSSYFEDEISKVDPSFFVRLEESKFHLEDRDESNKQKYALFHDKDYTDVDFFKEYPTIFHLRKKLIESNEPVDVRLVYLALLNMFKHRGNFLNSSIDSEQDVTDMETAWQEFVDTAEMFGIFFGDHIEHKKVERILSEKGMSKSQIAEKLCEYLDVKKTDKSKYELVLLLCGRKGKLVNIYGSDVVNEEHKAFSFSYRDSNYDEKEAEAIEIVGEEYFELLRATKAVHDIGLLASILKGQKYLTYARVESYENHKEDLALLKKVLKKYSKDDYNYMFRGMESGSYSAYVGSVNSGIIKVRRKGQEKDSAVLYKKIKDMLGKYPQEDEDVQTILSKIEMETFLPKQLTSDNGVIPNQVYVREMKAILGNAEQYLPFLLDKDEYNLTVSERILQLFSFRIPYYVGPLGQEYLDKPGYNVWAKRIAPGKILPWNFEEKIDTKGAAEKFIERMVRHCTYLKSERTLPKNSLMYERYMVLNELNNLRVHGEKISVDTKQDIYNELFVRKNKVTVKDLEKYFISQGIVDPGETDFLSGIDLEGGIKSSLSTLHKFKGIFGEDVLLEKNRNIIENIVFWITVYGDDKKFVKDRIEEKYPGVLAEAQIKRITGFKFSGWGNLSKEFLNMSGTAREDQRSILTALWETNDNLMELLSERYTYKDALAEKISVAEKELSEWSYEDLDGMYLSAPVKRMIWQTIKIMNELTEVLGKTPDRVFVEMPREDGEKGTRTISRKKKISELYATLGKEGKDWRAEVDAREEADFKIKKLYLYYMQMGRCMYTGKPIDLDLLLKDNTAYDIDHIYPRHFITDNNIDNNLVLVDKRANARKSDTYPIDADIQSSQSVFWKSLLNKKFLSKEKYYRLTRKTQFSEEEKASFIARQLVETRQGTKAITQIIQQAFPNTTVVFSKAGEVSKFRQHYDMEKVRSVNNLHHAKDAYLNIVVGNTYYVKFTNNPLNFIKKAEKDPNNSAYKYHMDKIFEYDVVRGTETAWIGTAQGSSPTLNTVKSTMKKNTPLITKRSYVTHGALTRKDTVWSTEKAKNLVYLPMSSDPRLADVTKYGGRSDIATQCYCLVEYKLKGKRVLSIEALPVYLGDIETLSEEKILEYLSMMLTEENSGKSVTDVVLKYKCIRMKSKIKLDGHYYYIAGRTDPSIYIENAVELYLDYKLERYIKKVEKAKTTGDYGEKERDGKLIITKENNELVYSKFLMKLESHDYSQRKVSIYETLDDGQEKFSQLTVEDQCNVLLQIVIWFGTVCIGVDLSLIGGGNKKGICRMNKRVTNATELKLVCSSPTGLLEHTIDLLAL